MSNKRSVRALLVCVPVLCFLSSSALQAQWADYMELTCAAPKGIWSRAIGKIKGFIPGFAKESPICAARTQEALVLLTGVMLDRAALAAAQGLDEVQVALSLKQTLVQQIEELKRAVGGLGTGGKGNASEVIITEITAQATELSAELERRKAAGTLTPDVMSHLVTAQQSLHEVQYYGLNAIAGGNLIRQFIQSNGSKAALFAALDSPQIGFGSDFARRLPDRSKKLPPTFAGAITLRQGIGKVLDNPDKYAKEGEKAAKEKAKSDGERIQRDLDSFNFQGTPRDTAGTSE